MPARVGPDSSVPVIDMPPPMPWATTSNAGRLGSGPVCPKPVTEQVMILGLTMASDAWSMASRSVTPAEKLSSTMSTLRTRS